MCPYLSKIECHRGGAGDAEETFFCLAGDTAKQKDFRPFNASLITGALTIRFDLLPGGIEFLIHPRLKRGWIRRILLSATSAARR
jgi:hypothetical protein